MTPSEITFAGIWQLLLAAVGLGVVIAQHRAACREPMRASVPAWRATAQEFFGFVGVALICLILIGALCAAAARRIFPETDFSGHALYLVPAMQTAALCALLAARKFLPSLFPPQLDAEEKSRPRGWLSPANRFGVPAFFAAGIFAVSAGAIFVGAATAFFPEHIREIFQENQLLVQELKTLDSALVAALCVPAIAVLTPILEELIFRGGLYLFLKSKMSAVPAAALSSVIFALMHDAPVSYLPLTLLGCVLCFAYEKTGRIAAPILIHALFNANSLFCLFLDR